MTLNIHLVLPLRKPGQLMTRPHTTWWFFMVSGLGLLMFFLLKIFAFFQRQDGTLKLTKINLVHNHTSHLVDKRNMTLGAEEKDAAKVLNKYNIERREIARMIQEVYGKKLSPQACVFSILV